MSDAINRTSASSIWPTSIEIEPIRENLRHLELFRDNSVHFYNAKDFGVVVYSLAQTAIRNYQDLLREVFRESLADEISWELLPLGVKIPSDPLEFLAGKGSRSSPRSHAVNDFIFSLNQSVRQIGDEGKDTSRLLTVLDVALRSVKKVDSADIVVGIDGSVGGGNAIIVKQIVDPNNSHPYLTKDVVRKVKDSRTPFNIYDFQAIASTQRLRTNRQYCWTDLSTNGSKWSRDTVTLMVGLPRSTIDAARKKYAAKIRAKQLKRRRS